jgi:hypothetical protein
MDHQRDPDQNFKLRHCRTHGSVSLSGKPPREGLVRDPIEIKTRADFVAFVAELEADLKSHPNEWENLTLETFLNALGAWAEGFRLRVNAPASLDRPQAWSLAAMLLWAGRTYE